MGYELWSAIGSPVIIAVSILIGLLVLYLLLRYCRVYIYINSDEFGVIEKVWSRKGSVTSGFIALGGKAGFQPNILRTGPHLFLPFLYRIHRQKLITVRTMAYVYARDGKPLPAGQTLARTPEGANFEDVAEFLRLNGQRGPQRAILREGIYAINTAQFVVFTDSDVHAIDIGNDLTTLTHISDLIRERNGFSPVFISDMASVQRSAPPSDHPNRSMSNVSMESADTLGVVTVHDGPALDPDTLIAPTVGNVDDPSTFHNSYQDIEAFLRAGGRRGRQEQVIVEGTYYINRLFATIEVKPKTIIPVGKVGVVISYTGSRGEDISGTDYKHGELVSEGHRGVLAEAKRPGKYAINPYAMHIEEIPTTNFVLRWIQGRVEDHGYDRTLSEIPLITSDAFQPKLPLSVVVHIAPERAPRVIQQFASIELLVNQTLDPIVSAFFKDAAQKNDFISLIRQRAELQADALAQMRERFARYDLDLQEVMIGTPSADTDNQIKLVLDQLRERQVAEQQKETFRTQQEAAEVRKNLNEATAIAEAQAGLTRSNIDIEIAKNRGLATLAEREQDAAATKAIGLAEAAVIDAKGTATASATEKQVAAFEGIGAEFTFRRSVAEQFAQAIIATKVPIVPQIVSGGGSGNSATIVDAMAAMLMQKMANDLPQKPAN
jgi:uncharacterized membrane protein YqiK